ncbi:MAG: helix-turn-helix domain-containing protein [Bacteroidota bacterium]|nr:helix-turn-helix domain-containing protein [Bacteroidota bacterium]
MSSKQHFANNIKILRQRFGYSQHDAAEKLGLPRTTLGDYERGYTEPNFDLLTRIAQLYQSSLEHLLLTNLEMEKPDLSLHAGLRVLAMSTNEQGKQNIELVRTKAEAGYIENFNDPEYIRELPKLSLPQLPQGYYRAFEIRGDSMLPLEPGSMVICSYVRNLTELKNGQTYVIISRDNGIVYKRVQADHQNKLLHLQSDNPVYHAYSIAFEELTEIWQYYAHLAFRDPNQSFHEYHDERLQDIHKTVHEIKEKMIGN